MIPGVGRLQSWCERRWPRAAVAAIAGACICFSLPPWGWWPLTIIGIALWCIALSDRGVGQRFWVGAVVGLTWFLPSTLWMLTFSPPGWIAGVGVWFPFVAGFGSMACPPRRVALALPATLVIAEWVRWHAPFGGVPLSVIADTQGQGPLLAIARLAGALGVTLAVAASGAALATALTGSAARRKGAALAVLAVVLTTMAGALAVPGSEGRRSIRVAVVQGGGEQQTISARTDYSEVLARHIRVAETVRGPVDLVVLPENIVNIANRFTGSEEEAKLVALARELDATVVAGVVEGENSPTTFRNAAVAIEPDGRVVARYDKVRRVPFGEYTPMRSLMEPLAEAFGSFVPPRDAIPGDGPAILDTELGRLGTAISWEVFFPRRLREAAHLDADVMLNPTNGSSYWLTQVQAQQVNQSALRAVESGRWLLQSSPTGFSAVIDPAGNVVERSDLRESAVLVHTIQLGGPTTLATRTGDLLPWVAALVLLASAWGLQRRDSRPETLDGEISSRPRPT